MAAAKKSPTPRKIRNHAEIGADAVRKMSLGELFAFCTTIAQADPMVARFIHEELGKAIEAATPKTDGG